MSIAFELPRRTPIKARQVFRTQLRVIRARVPDVEPEPVPVAQAPAFDPLAPSRAACRALVRRYVSLAREEALADVLLIARTKVIARDYGVEPLCSGATLGQMMLHATRRGLSRPDVLRRDAMAFAMLRLEAEHGEAIDWRLYEDGFSRDEVEEHGLEAAQLAEAITRIIADGARQ